MEISADHPNENKQKVFIQSLLQHKSQAASFAFGRDSQADKRDGKLYKGAKRLQVAGLEAAGKGEALIALTVSSTSFVTG